jgi:hypothetical protein
MASGRLMGAADTSHLGAGARVRKRTKLGAGGSAMYGARKRTSGRASKGAGNGACVSTCECASLCASKGAGNGARVRAREGAGLRTVNVTRGNWDGTPDTRGMGIATQGATLARHHIDHQVFNAKRLHFVLRSAAG